MLYFKNTKQLDTRSKSILKFIYWNDRYKAIIFIKLYNGLMIQVKQPTIPIIIC